MLSSISPIYDTFDEGHNWSHATGVAEAAKRLAAIYAPRKQSLAHIAAITHDLGLQVNREEHEVHGGKIVRKDPQTLEVGII